MWIIIKDFCWIKVVVLPGQPESGAGGEIPRLDPGCRSVRSRLLDPWWEAPFLLSLKRTIFYRVTSKCIQVLLCDACHRST